MIHRVVLAILALGCFAVLIFHSVAGSPPERSEGWVSGLCWSVILLLMTSSGKN